MNLSLLTFSMMREEYKKEMNALDLCRIVKDNGIQEIDLMAFEIQMLGEDALLAASAQTSVKVGCIISPVRFITNPEGSDAELKELLALCGRMGCQQLMIIPGGGKGQEPEDLTGITWDDMTKRAVDFFSKAVPTATAQGMAVGLENTPQIGKPFYTEEQCLSLMKAVPGLKLIFDIGNVLVAGEHTDIMAFYEALRPYIMRVHVKEVIVGDFPGREKTVDGKQILPVAAGAGVTGLRALLKKMAKDGYNGTFAVEYAAHEGVAGREGHTTAVAPYAAWIRDVLSGEDLTPPYGTIEGLNKPVSRIFFGTAIMPLVAGGDATELLDAMYAQGINAFDCARGYGYAEKSLGEWVKSRGLRKKVVILTKCGNVTNNVVHVNREIILKEIEDSLTMLQMEYVDIFLLHRDDPKTPVSEIIDTLNELKAAGKIRVFGASNWTWERIAEANAYAKARGLYGFSVSEPNYSLAEQVSDPWGGDCITLTGDQNAAQRRAYAESGMPVLAYSSLGRGFFSGRFQAGDYDAARKCLDPFAQKGYLYPVNMERLARAEKIAEKKGVTVAEIAMRWLFASDMNMYALVSTSNPFRMKLNIRAALNPLTREEADELENGK